MGLEKYRCLRCGSARWKVSSTVWTCEECQRNYPCRWGVPKLVLDEKISSQDRRLRDRFYDGIFGKYYSFTMACLLLPVRPIRLSWPHWVVYAATIFGGAGLGLLFAMSIVHFTSALRTALYFFVIILVVMFFLRHKHFFYLLVLAIPTRISLLLKPFRPEISFSALHAEVIDRLKASSGRLEVLDICTGNCSSLYKHGWMELNAAYTGLDLSETMLAQGLDFMSQKGIPIDLVVGDALNLPFQDDTFDVILNYGALNAFADQSRAVAEMYRVAKPGTMLVVLDEQLYGQASTIERWYFGKVLSGHNTVHRCPAQLFTLAFKDVQIAQVYHFYYMCVATKSA